MPEEGWTMQDGTAWPGNNPRDHPGMIQVLPFSSKCMNNLLPLLYFQAVIFVLCRCF